MDEFYLHVIGCGSALSMHGRHPSAQVLQRGNFNCLIDCGEGTQDRLKEAGIKAFKINTILISHLHGDHVFGLPGLLGSLSHLKRTAPLTIYGPKGIKGMLESIFSFAVMKFTFPLEIIENEPTDLTTLWSDQQIEIKTFPLNHRISCNGYLVREIQQKIKFRKEVVEAYKPTPNQIKAIEAGETIQIDGAELMASAFVYPPEEPVSYAYCSDTRYDERILPWIKDVSVLYHETTFMEDKLALADQTGHSTAQQAAHIAVKANAGCLMTGHYSSRYKDLELLVEEARKIFNPVILAEEGKKYKLESLLNRGKS